MSYTLTSLAQNQLKMTRQEVPSAEIPAKFGTAASLLSLTKATEHDAWLSLGLLFHLSVLPLSRQLSNIAGVTWSKTLQHTRAARVEHLLLHEFHARKFLLPDKLSAKERKHGRGACADAEDEDGGEVKAGKKKGGPAYAGGLVLEPKKGLYDKYVLMLDFNSLYPSIIQEYDICFTTVARPKPDPADPDAAPPPVSLPSRPPAAGRPQRRGPPAGDPQARAEAPRRQEPAQVRAQPRGARAAGHPAARLQAHRQLDVRLPRFAASRFYAKPLAELTTLQGREILQSTVDLAQGTLGLDVVYGDTDSIMINTNSNNLQEVMSVGTAVKKEVNKRYRLLEIEIDGVYKSMLLLKKKKYAALKVEHGVDGQITTVMEQKGLDIVRRDWSLIAKAQGNRALDLILSGRPAEDVVEDIHESLRKCREDLVAGAVTMDQFVITKQLTKRPEDYPDAANQAHVQVALRLRGAGKHEGTNQGETVPYVIAVKTDASGEDIAAGKCGAAGGKGLADRAYHPDEVTAEGSGLKLDLHYYLTQQVHPVVSRLCQPIEGTDAARIADCLGLDRASSTTRWRTPPAPADDDFLNAGSRWTTRSASDAARRSGSRRRRALSTSRASPRSSRGRWTATPRWRRRPKTPAAPRKRRRRQRRRRRAAPAKAADASSSARPSPGTRWRTRCAWPCARPLWSTTRRRCARTTSSRPPRRATCPCAWPARAPASRLSRGRSRRPEARGRDVQGGFRGEPVHAAGALPPPALRAGRAARLPEKERDAARARAAGDGGGAALAVAAVDETLVRSAYRWINLRELYGAAGVA